MKNAGPRRFWSGGPINAARLELACWFAALGFFGALIGMNQAAGPQSTLKQARSASITILVGAGLPLGEPRRCIRRLVDLGQQLSEETLAYEIDRKCFGTAVSQASRTTRSQAPLACSVGLGRRPLTDVPPVAGCLLD
jgi:hypothetical protein